MLTFYDIKIKADFIPLPPSPSLALRDFPHKWGKNFFAPPLSKFFPRLRGKVPEGRKGANVNILRYQNKSGQLCKLFYTSIRFF
ncbi:hypothetical protein Q7511_10920, partial [Glaesserella parasuis]|nr:hypothetical protein [Glaesserella parasuis]